jgi:hypothetical protein
LGAWPNALPMAGGRRPGEVRHEQVMSQVEDILAFSGMQGARTLMERLEDDDQGRRRMRVRVVRGEGKSDFVYDVLVEASGLMGIYRTA